MGSELRYLVERWDALRQVGDVFAIAVLIVIVVAFGVMHWLFRTRLESKDAIIAELKSKLDHRVDELREAREQRDRLEAARTAFPAMPPADQPAPTGRQSESTSAVRRDVTLSEALAFAELHQWGMRFIDAAGVADNRVVEHLERAVQLAADGELTLWGKLDGNGVWVKVPPEHWRDWDVEWFGLLRGEAYSEARGITASLTSYSALMASRAEFESHFPVPDLPAMRILSTAAPPLLELRQQVLSAHESIRANDASADTIARIRQTMASLEHSDEQVWSLPDAMAARRDLLRLWERLYGNVELARRYEQISRARGEQIGYFHSAAEGSEMLAQLEDAVERLSAAIAGRPTPAVRRFRRDA